jgi:hypothetical protein
VLGRDSSIHYPLNTLRNIAWNHAPTKFIFSLDIDFIPSDNLERVLRRLNPYYVEKLSQKSILIVPTFNLFCKFDQLKDVACSRTTPLYSHSQNSTNYGKWFKATEPYLVDYDLFFEPYFIGPKSMVKYDETFTVGHDKTTHLYELAAASYKMYVLNYAYIGHVPHSSGMKHTLSQKFYHFHEVWKLWETFVKRIEKQYNVNYYCDIHKDYIGYINDVIRERRKKLCE